MREASARDRWAWLLPRFDEPIEPEVYRLSAKIRVFVTALLVLSNVGAYYSLADLQWDRDVFIWFHVFNSPLLFLNIPLSLYLWKRATSLTTMRWITIYVVTIEALSCVFNMWIHGSVTGYMTTLAIVLFVIYRVFYDFFIGFLLFLLTFVGFVAIVTMEASGILVAQPITLEPAAGALLLPVRTVGAALVVGLMMITAFITTNWAVARLRHKERAIQLLRAHLAATSGGELGQHTGKILSSTYEVGTLLGVGAMGEVYRGRHLRTGRGVAIKSIHPHLIADDRLLRRFEREAEIIGKLGCPHIVQCIDVNTDEGQPYLVLELLEGQDLASRLRERPLTLDEIADLSTQVARGLASAHAAGVVHRDLKPENIFLSLSSGIQTVKILDFGVSKIRGNATALTQDVALLGTPDFMSPEQARGVIDEVDPRTDVFALGAILYNMVTGRRPFSAPSIPATLRKILDEEPVPVSELRADLDEEVCKGLDAVIAIAIAKDTRERYATAPEAADDLAQVVARRAQPALYQRAAALTRGRPASRSVIETGRTAITATGDTAAAGAPLGDTLQADGSAATLDADLG